ncbi:MULTISPECIES: hypothetical protein [unclassified Methylobacterium]|uniref:hypothetical protein n=1 Tax=unclassified Methylobacterium TaxID=2615210 RepID=UPI0011CA842B|nr:hypothetical protein [Methylobacterium sp. WL64]TXN02274.1 hypothetical protein FV242_15595 [Methylobacterium sp. WL64]
MADVPADTQAQRMPHGKPKSEGLANAPLDTATGTVKPQDGPMDRAGTEAEEAARGGTSLGAERDKPSGR